MTLRNILIAKITFTILLLSQTLYAATLHLVLVGDTNDNKIGKSVNLDIGEMEKFMGVVRVNTNLVLKQTKLVGADLSKNKGYKAVRNAVLNLSVNNDDVVVFYYSGHGGRFESDKSRWPSLAVEGVYTRSEYLLPLDWVVKTLQDKKPRFFMAIADACNSIVGSARYSRTPSTRGAANAFQKLFLGYKGHIIASGSIPKQYSFGEPSSGGLFTNQLMAALSNAVNSSSNLNWEDIMKNATKPIKVNSPTQKVQNPQYHAKVTPISFDAPPPVFPDTDDTGSPVCPDGNCNDTTTTPEPDCDGVIVDGQCYSN